MSSFYFQLVRLTFEDFQLEFDEVCGYDDLSVYEGNSASSTLIRRVCGDSLPSPIQSASNKMFIQFLTDKDTGYYGFKAKIEFVNPPGKIISNSIGVHCSIIVPYNIHHILHVWVQELLHVHVIP